MKKKKKKRERRELLNKRNIGGWVGFEAFWKNGGSFIEKQRSNM